MVGWHHRHHGHESEQGPGVGDGQGGLACCGPWGCKQSDTPKRLNNSNKWNTERTTFKLLNFIYFLAALGLCCCAGAFSSGPCGFLTAGASLIAGSWARFSGCSFGAPPRGEVKKKISFCIITPIA